MLKIRDLNIRYQRDILKDVKFSACNQAVTLIKGESGSGKTSLLYRIALLTKEDSYKYSIGDVDIGKCNTSQKSNIRRNHIGYVLQDSLLIDHYDVAQNIKHAAQISNMTLSNQDIIELLKEVEMDIPLDRKVDTLSGGERQRIAIACALAKNCEIIVLDEPTSALNEEVEIKIFKLMRKLAYERGKCIIVASHSSFATQYADKVYQIDKGHLQCIQDNHKNNEIQLKDKKKKIKTKVLWEYVLGYMRLHKRKWTANIAVTGLSFFLICLTVLGVREYQVQSQQTLLQTADNQVYISTIENGDYVDVNQQVVPESLIEAISKNQQDKIQKIYPYIYACTDILGEKVDILPYFKENDFTAKYDKEYTVLDDGPVLGYETAQLLKRNNIASQFLDIDLSIRFDKSGEIKYIDNPFSGSVKGVLKEGINNFYGEKNYFIYFPYEYLESISKQKESNEYIGYTIFSKNFEKHTLLNDELKNYEISINDSFQNTSGLNDTIKSSQFIEMIMISIVFIGTLFIVVLMFIHNFHLRKREFVLSVITGLSYKDILKIGFIESVIQNIISFIIYFGISISVMIFMKLSGIMIMEITGLVCLEMILIIIVILFFNCLQMRYLSVEDVLRS